MKITRFEDIIAWQKAKELTITVYRLFKVSATRSSEPPFEDILAWQKAKELTISVYCLFKDCKDYFIRGQIQRASVSIMNNIADGYEI